MNHKLDRKNKTSTESGRSSFLSSLMLSFYQMFSHSLIIHQVKTEKITTVKEVWITGLN